MAQSEQDSPELRLVRLNQNPRQGSASDRTFKTPELLEHILLYLLEDLISQVDHEDPRSENTQTNASILFHLVRCSQVDRTWHNCIFQGSRPLQRALFLREDNLGARSWQIGRQWYDSQHDYHQEVEFRAPILNPMIRATFPTYRFRLWRAAVEAFGPKHRAYLIVTRKDAMEARDKLNMGKGRTVSRMLLSRPPMVNLEAVIWERDLEKIAKLDQLSRTEELSRPVIHCEQGVTLGLLHRRVGEMFDEHTDVMAVKITTV